MLCFYSYISKLTLKFSTRSRFYLLTVQLEFKLRKLEHQYCTNHAASFYTVLRLCSEAWEAQTKHYCSSFMTRSLTKSTLCFAGLADAGLHQSVVFQYINKRNEMKLAALRTALSLLYHW